MTTVWPVTKSLRSTRLTIVCATSSCVATRPEVRGAPTVPPPGGVNEDFGAAHPSPTRGALGPHGSFAADVPPADPRPTAERLRVPHNRLGLALAARVVDRHVTAAPRQRERGGPPDAGGGSRDQRRLAFDLHRLHAQQPLGVLVIHLVHHRDQQAQPVPPRPPARGRELPVIPSEQDLFPRPP